MTTFSTRILLLFFFIISIIGVVVISTATLRWVSSVQLLSRVRLFATPGTAASQLHCSSPTPWACSNSCPSCQWCHPTISSSVVPFSSCLQSFPASRSFPMSQFFASGSQSIGASASVLPMNIWLGIELGSPALEGGFSTTGLPGKSSLKSTYSRRSAMNFKNNLISALQLSYIKTQCNYYFITRKTGLSGTK